MVRNAICQHIGGDYKALTGETAQAAKETTQAAGETAGNPDKTEGAGAPVTISYACWDSNQGDLLRTVADEFEKQNPNIKIDIQVNSWDNY